MEPPGRRRNRRQKPFTRSPHGDIILNHYGGSTFPRAMVLEDLSRFLPCEIERCKPCTCWPWTPSLKQRLIRTLTDFGEAAAPQMLLKPASSHSVETTGR